MQQTLPTGTTTAVAAESQASAIDVVHPALTRRRVRRGLRRAFVLFFRLVTVLVAAVFLQAAALAWQPTLLAHMADATPGLVFNMLTWMAHALGDKALDVVQRPAASLDEREAAVFVEAFMERARTVGDLEDKVEALTAQGAPDAELQPLSAEIAGLRAEHERDRPTAEAILERQVSAVLAEFGFGAFGQPLPPVLFRFSASPAELIVSPRERINTAARLAVLPGLPVAQLEQIEAEVEADAGGGVSTIIVPTGGVGAFPTLVVNYGHLDWEVNTVAHEWAHTYLAFFPLGITYGAHPDTTLINETVAEIVGDEVGRRVLERFYPWLVAPQVEAGGDFEPAPLPPLRFDYFAEMRHTRETLDKFLALGKVDEAEKYLELRRLLFVENGYNLRKLNQAWFAFHGSYGAGAAASVAPVITQEGDVVEPLAPMVLALRETAPDLAEFLRLARGLTTRADLEAALAGATVSSE